MKYTDPYILLLIPATAIAVILLYIACAKRKQRILKQLLNSGSRKESAIHLSYSARRWKLFLLLLGMAVIICGAARPYRKMIHRPADSSGSDIMVIFDVSKSMRATDLPPSRLEHAKYLLREIVNAFPGNRFGLIAFAGNAFLSCPLTADPGAIKEYISELNTDTVPLGGTNIERALRIAEKAFGGAEGNDRAILLLTDGDELSGNAERLMPELKAKKIPLIIAGFGDPSLAAPVPDGKGGFMRQPDGKAAASCLNETGLQKLARESGGFYVRSTTADTGFNAIAGKLRSLEASGRSVGGTLEPVDEFHWFFAGGIVLLLLSVLIPEYRDHDRSRRQLVLLLLSAACFGSIPLNGAENRTAPPLPANPVQLYNLALEEQKKGSPEAEKLYEEAISNSSGDPVLQSRAMHNLGVGCHLAGRQSLQKARQLTAAQQLDQASSELKKSRSSFDRSRELYTQVLSTPDSDIAQAAGNLRQLELDRQELDELEKKIEELKKQQQKARQQAADAAKNNQSQQNQTDDRQQQSQDKMQQQIKQAAESSRQLADKASQMKQDKMQQQAENAAAELDKAAAAQQNGRPREEIQKHLDKAVEALGKPEEKKQPDEKNQTERSAAQDKTGKEQKAPAPASAAEKQKLDEKKRSGLQQLEMMAQEEDKLRDMMRRRQMELQRRNPVDKDW